MYVLIRILIFHHDFANPVWTQPIVRTAENGWLSLRAQKNRKSCSCHLVSSKRQLAFFKKNSCQVPCKIAILRICAIAIYYVTSIFKHVRKSPHRALSTCVCPCIPITHCQKCHIKTGKSLLTLLNLQQLFREREPVNSLHSPQMNIAKTILRRALKTQIYQIPI